jgi:hypothetical protein
MPTTQWWMIHDRGKNMFAVYVTRFREELPSVKSRDIANLYPFGCKIIVDASTLIA